MCVVLFTYTYNFSTTLQANQVVKIIIAEIHEYNNNKIKTTIVKMYIQDRELAVINKSYHHHHPHRHHQGIVKMKFPIETVNTGYA